MSLTPQELDALVLSVQVSVLATAISLPLAVALGWVLARRTGPGVALIDTLLALPLVLPPVVTGYLLLLVFGSRGLLGPWLEGWFGLSFSFDWKGAALASAVVSFPLMARTIRVSLSAVDPHLEQVARTLGARPRRVFFTVTLPLALPGVLAGASLGLARAMGEFGATITFVGNIAGETRTLPLALYTFLQQPEGEGPAWRLLVLSVLLALVALGAHEFCIGRLRCRGGQLL